MKASKVLVSVLLLLALCLSMMSITALAEGPVTAAKSISADLPQSEPGEGGETTPGEGGETTPGEGGETTPGEGGETTPGEGGETTPGEGGETTPGEGGETTPGEGGETTPGEGGEGEGGEGEGGEGEGGEGEETKPETQGTVSPANTIYYYKGGTGLGGDKTFTVNAQPVKVLVYVSDPSSAKELKFGFSATKMDAPEEGGTVLIPESENRATLESLGAGAYFVEFQFKEAKSTTIDLYVILSLTLNNNQHLQGSGSTIVATLTDLPDVVLVSDNSNLSTAITLTPGTDYTVSGNTVTLTAEYLDSLVKSDKVVTKYVGFAVNYRGTNLAAPYAFTVVPNASIDPTEATWKRGTDKSFTVKPNTVSVAIDGVTITKETYTVSGNKLTLKPAAISIFGYGEHTLTVQTSAGPVTAKITLEPSLGYSSFTGNQHTKGGNKVITFIASDPVVKVKVNGTEISAENYTLSEDKKNITLTAAYLNTLKADTTYTITAVITADEKETEVSSSFRILTGGSGNSSSSGGSAGRAPQTGDTDTSLWLALLMISGCTAVAILPRLKKEQ